MSTFVQTYCQHNLNTKNQSIMKKLLIFAALAMILAACNNDDAAHDDGGKTSVGSIQPIEMGEEVAAFFDEHAGIILHEMVGDVSGNGSFMVNSAEDLPKIVGEGGAPLEYPPVDFDAHTLIIGQWIGGGGLRIESQTLVNEQNAATLYLTVTQMEDENVDYDGGIYPVFFGTLYPKFDAERIDVDVTYK